MARSPVRVLRLAACTAFAVAALGLSGCGLHQGRTALAIQRVEPLGFSGSYRLVVECADDVEVTVGEDHGGSDLPEVTVWGVPKLGRCHPDVALPFGREAFVDRPGHPALRKFVDGATSQVVELPS